MFPIRWQKYKGCADYLTFVCQFNRRQSGTRLKSVPIGGFESLNLPNGRRVGNAAPPCQQYRSCCTSGIITYRKPYLLRIGIFTFY
jgi:hypothetical protein